MFLDITATHEKRDTIAKLARRTADEVFVPFTIGGGIRSVADAQAVLDAGADKVSVNSAALERPELLDELAARVRRAVRRARDRRQDSASDGGWEAYLAGGRTPTGRDVVEWAREGVERGAGEILLTSMDRDGTSDGYDLQLTRAVSEAVSVPVIASGGAGELEHLVAGAGRGRGRGAVRFDLPLRPLHRRRGQGPPRRGRDPGAQRLGARPVSAADADHAARGRCSSAARPPGGRELLALGAPARDLALVGGAVRDLLLGRAPRELDVVVAGDAAELARSRVRRELASGAPAAASVSRVARALRHAPSVERAADGRVDIAERRAESYPAPGRAAPRCARARARRTSRGGTSPSTRSPSRSAARAGASCRRAEHALEDLGAGRLRVLHERSFVDDPTRLLRLARYRARLRLRARAAAPPSSLKQALRDGRAEDRLAARGSAPSCGSRWAKRTRPRRSTSLSELGVLGRSRPRLRLRPRARRRALAAAAERRTARSAAAGLAAAAADRREPATTPSATMYELLDGLEFTAARARPRAAHRARRAGARPSDGARGCAVAAARGAGRAPAGGGRAGGRARQTAARAAARPSRRSVAAQRCATCVCRSPARTCSPPASPPGPEIGRRLRRTRSPASSTASSQRRARGGAAGGAWRAKARPS